MPAGRTRTSTVPSKPRSACHNVRRLKRDVRHVRSTLIRASPHECPPFELSNRRDDAGIRQSLGAGMALYRNPRGWLLCDSDIDFDGTQKFSNKVRSTTLRPFSRPQAMFRKTRRRASGIQHWYSEQDATLPSRHRGVGTRSAPQHRIRRHHALHHLYQTTSSRS